MMISTNKAEYFIVTCGSPGTKSIIVRVCVCYNVQLLFMTYYYTVQLTLENEPLYFPFIYSRPPFTG